ncbi:hypothetical protein PMAYCL1PPCAC_09622, partial [Pristionchus mayeri]
MDRRSKMYGNGETKHLKMDEKISDSSFIYVQMELCKTTLADWLNESDERSSARIKSWFKQIVEAVDYIHKKKMMHRDLKPSNILIASDDVVKICDLGIATDMRAAGSQTTLTNIGSIPYKAPEQTDYLKIPSIVVILPRSTRMDPLIRRKHERRVRVQMFQLIGLPYSVTFS